MASSPAGQVYIFQDFVNSTSTLPPELCNCAGCQCSGFSLRGSWFPPSSTEFYYGGTTCLHPQSLESAFTYTFDMDEMRLFGICSTAPDASQVSILLDRPYTPSFPLHGYTQIYQTPALSAVQTLLNNVTVTNSSCCFDLIVSVPSSHTSLADQTLMVDDSYDRIQYSGNWEVDTNGTFLVQDSPLIYGTTMMNSTHRTSTVGDTMKFPFTGLSLSVVGSILQTQIGNFTISYSVDQGTNTTRTFTIDGTSVYRHEPNVKLVDTGPLPVGDHTLTLTLTACINQTLVIDYILYTPTFERLADMPNIILPSPSPTTSQTTTTTLPSSPATNTNQAEASVATSSMSHVGAIIGGTIAATSVLMVCFLVFWFIRRRRRRSMELSYARPIIYTDSYMRQAAAPSTVVGGFGHIARPSNATAPDTLTSGFSSQPTSSVGSSPQSHDAVGELTRRFDDLTHQVERLQSTVVPPAYESETPPTRLSVLKPNRQ